MNKLAVLLLAALASKGALAGEVGAKTPHVAESVTLAYATTDAGTNPSEWAIGPVNTPATTAQHNQITEVAERLNAQVTSKLAVELYLKLENNL